jgi:nucleoside-diphosphate-sugar epimerase
MAELVLVAGGQGFLGRGIVDALRSRGIEAVGSSRQGGDAVRIDALDPPSMQSPAAAALRERMTHLVVSVGSADANQTPAGLATHLYGVKNLLRYAAQAPRLERVVLVSSMMVYGDAPQPSVTGVDFGQRHPTVYGFAKYRSELLVMDSGLPARRVRAGLLVGDGSSGAIPPGQPLSQYVRLALSLPVLPLAEGGAFPAWIVAVDRAASDVAAATIQPDVPEVTLSVDPDSPTLRALTEMMLAPYGRVPLIVDPGRRLSRSWVLRRALARAGAGPEWLAFAQPWARLARDDIRWAQATDEPHDGRAARATARHLWRELVGFPA